MILEEMGGELAGMGFGFYGTEEDFMMRKPTEIAQPPETSEESTA